MAGVGFAYWSQGTSIDVMTILQAGQMGNRDLNAGNVRTISGERPVNRRLLP